MNVTDETLDILIGKHIDGEITPSEQRILDRALEKDPRAKEHLEQLHTLHECCRRAVACETIGQGRSAEQIIDCAWQRGKSPLRKIIKTSGWLRFGAGLAAGIMIGLALYFMLPRHSPDQSIRMPDQATVQGTDNSQGTNRLVVPLHAMQPLPNITRTVDWYGFTDGNGVQWLIEGVRENAVRPAVYDGGL
ncbi:MAG: hypothetical protein ACYTBJ_23245 [Planctomycetota bacterium]|jgi:anti-sigma factor RsiW